MTSAEWGSPSSLCRSAEENQPSPALDARWGEHSQKYSSQLSSGGSPGKEKAHKLEAIKFSGLMGPTGWKYPSFLAFVRPTNWRYPGFLPFMTPTSWRYPGILLILPGNVPIRSFQGMPGVPLQALSRQLGRDCPPIPSASAVKAPGKTGACLQI